jgi:hypothetical protein
MISTQDAPAKKARVLRHMGPLDQDLSDLASMTEADALTFLSRIQDRQKQSRVTAYIALHWSRRDINAMWNAVTTSALDDELKRKFLIELWN